MIPYEHKDGCTLDSTETNRLSRSSSELNGQTYLRATVSKLYGGDAYKQREVCMGRGGIT